MIRNLRSCTLWAVLLVTTIPPSGHADRQDQISPPLGSIVPRVAVARNKEQSYALYLPTRYASEQRSPIVYVFDPAARGALAIEQFQHAAELNGFIVAGSNNSRNGPRAPQFEAADAMVQDTQQRFSVDTRRIYFAGFSGGARVASQLAQLCKCAAGVVLSGAGFPHNSPPSADARFPVFSAVGDADFNYSEMIPLQQPLEKAAFPHWLRVFGGPHQWAPPAVMDEALAWLRVQSMKSRREPRDDVFLSAQFLAAQARAASFEQSGDLLTASREYRQVAATFDTIADIVALRSKAADLEKAKAVREAIKREKNDFEEQERLGGEVLAAFSGTESDDSSPAESADRAILHARDLRLRAANEKKPDRALVFRRALGGVFVAAMESGSDALDKKGYRQAARQFACAAEANPESEWAFRNLAVAQALSGERKAVLQTLRSAKNIAKDAASFSGWLKEEPAFDRLRSSEEFQAILTSSADAP